MSGENKAAVVASVAPVLGDGGHTLRRRVVIVGAGVAGLVTARELERAGITDYLVVEAQNRIGGRVLTVSYDGRPLELGAQFVHGDKGNPIHELSAEHGLLADEPTSSDNKTRTKEDDDDEEEDEDEEDSEMSAESFRTISGKSLNEKAFDEAAVVADRIDERACEFYKGNSVAVQPTSHDNEAGDSSIVDSLGHFWMREYQKYLDSPRCKNDNKITKQLKAELYDWHDRFQGVENACNGMDDLSLKLWGMYVVRGADYELSQGYGKVLDLLVSSAALQERFWIGTPVARIDWSAVHKEVNLARTPPSSAALAVQQVDQTSTAKTGSWPNNGTGQPDGISKSTAEEVPYVNSCVASHASSLGSGCGISGSDTGSSRPIVVHLADGRILLADHVVITVSLGCLKRAHQALFHPVLPASKQHAIEKLQFGTTDKIYLIFDSPFWKDEDFVINFLWLNGDAALFQQSLSKFLPGQHSAGTTAGPAASGSDSDPWWRRIVQFHAVRHHPNMLEGWIAGSAAEQMEQEDEKSVLLICWQMLVCFRAAPKVPRPRSILRTRWHNTEYVYGSYSSTPPGSTEGDMREYGKPVCVGKVPRLLFAGEGTVVTDYSTVHGAYMSGMEAAKTLLDHLHSERRSLNASDKTV